MSRAAIRLKKNPIIEPKILPKKTKADFFVMSFNSLSIISPPLFFQERFNITYSYHNKLVFEIILKINISFHIQKFYPLIDSNFLLFFEHFYPFLLTLDYLF